MTGASTSITDLFLEYLRTQEEERPPNEDELLERAGSRSQELRGRIAAFELVRGMAARRRSETRVDPVELARFETLEILAEGGMGVVYLARDEQLGRLVALKILHPMVLGGRSSRELILNESRSLARLEHPGVVKIHQIDRIYSSDCVVMEYLAGPSLADVIARLGDPDRGGVDEYGVARRLRPIPARIECLARIAEALAYCHGCGVVHRDVKSSNVLFDEEGRPVLIDFGLAHVADEAGGGPGPDLTQRLVGTPACLAPEQIETMRAGRDPRSDQFSLGVLAYELLTLHQPFQRDTRTATLEAVTREAPESLRKLVPDCPGDVERIVMKALEKAPRDRYGGVLELARDLRAVLEHRPVSVGSASFVRKARLALRRHRVRALVTTAAILLVLATLFGRSLVIGLERDDRILAGLETVVVRELSGPIEILEAGRVLEELQVEGRGNEGTLLHLFREPAASRVEERAREWSQHARDGLSAELLAAEEEGREFQLPVTWSRVLFLESTLLPGIEDAEGFGLYGKVLLRDPLPEGMTLDLYRQEVATTGGRDAALTAFRRVPLQESLVPGAYRLHGWRDVRSPPVTQFDFVVTNEWQAPLYLDLIERGELAREAVDVPAESSEARGVPRFKVLPRVVTRGEVMDFLAETDREVPDSFLGTADLDAPAWVDHRLAVDFARARGARLPSGVELDVAVASGVLTIADVADRSHAEWLSEMPPSRGTKTAFMLNKRVYEAYRRGGDVDLISCFEPVDRATGVESGGTGVSFRLAFSADERSAY